jgi:nitroreductase
MFLHGIFLVSCKFKKVGGRGYMGQVAGIYRRRSIRRYLNEELQVGILEEIKDVCQSSIRLYMDIDMDIHIVEEGIKIQNISKGIIGNYGKILAPHYIVVTSEKREGYLENAGFVSESIVLSLTEMNIGTCFLGGSIKKQLLKNIIPIKKDHEVVIVISFGYPRNDKNMSKKIIRSRKRMEISEFTTGNVTKTWQYILDAVRMAPSAMNCQPWRFFINRNIIDIYTLNKNYVFKKYLQEMNPIAGGIALYNLYVAANRVNKEIDIKRLPGKERDGYKYITSIIETIEN